MQRSFVSSSNISSIGYDPKTYTLEIEFHSGGVYQYHDIPQSEYDALMSASSHGSYFARNIKNRYSYSRA